MGLVPEKVIFMGNGPRKGHFYGDWTQKKSFLWGPVPEKVIFMGTGPRKSPIIIGQKEKKILFLWIGFIFMGLVLGNMIQIGITIPTVPEYFASRPSYMENN